MNRRLVRVVLWSMVCLACMSCSQAQGDLDADILDVFGPPPTNLQEQDNANSCTCMPFHTCKYNTTRNTPQNTTHALEENEYGENVITIRIGPDDHPAECNHYLDKCCFPADVSTTPKPNRTPPVDACGLRQSDGVGFRINGGTDQEANYGEFPWMVAVMKRDQVKAGVAPKSMECGGSIIHPQVVLTGAHCVRGKKDLYIRAGEWDTQTEKEIYPTQDRDVDQVIIHEDFYVGGLLNDVALLVLSNPLELSPVVGTLCLPEQGEEMDGRNCVVSGWGQDVFGKEGQYQVILKRVEQPVVSRAPCLEAMRQTRLGPRFKLHESFICAGGQAGKDTCKGDGGSPLACPSKDDPRVYVQAGIVAWGVDCGTTTPAAYVNVPHFRKWIDDKLASLQLS